MEKVPIEEVELSGDGFAVVWYMLMCGCLSVWRSRERHISHEAMERPPSQVAPTPDAHQHRSSLFVCRTVHVIGVVRTEGDLRESGPEGLGLGTRRAPAVTPNPARKIPQA